MHIEAENMDTIQRLALEHILAKGQPVTPRGLWSQEIRGVTIRLTNPRARLIYSPQRKLSLPFAIGELLWYLRGSDQADIVSFYNPRIRDFSDDGQTLHGAYGKRLFSPELTGVVQWDAVVELLRADRDTRQAILHFHLPSDLQIISRDIPCTCLMQMFIREDKLECLVMMRSNDIMWGTPYDIFSFTMLQEIMARELGIEPGPYTHVIGSLHIYERHLKVARQILDEPPTDNILAMQAMPVDPWPSIRQLLTFEEKLRQQAPPLSLPEHPYWRDMALILQGYVAGKQDQRDDLDRILQALPASYASLIQRQFPMRKSKASSDTRS